MTKELIQKIINNLEDELYLADKEKKKANVLQFDKVVGYANGISVAIGIIEEICKDYSDKAKEKSNLSENLTSWIMCDEKMPEDEENVIITTKAGNVMAGKYTKDYGFRMSEGFMCGNCFIYSSSVIAWMHLPKPYKKTKRKEINTNYYIERFTRIN